MHVTFLILDQTNMLALSAAVDPLRAANRKAGLALFDWVFATPTATPARLTSGLDIPATPLRSIEHTDLLIVVASFDIAAQSTAALAASLRRLSANARVAGVDGGAWLLARAGLLDGHRATVHWEDLEPFAERFPAVDVVNARYVVSGNRWTCGGAAPAMDMMLALLTDLHGAELSGRVAASLIHAPAAPTHPQHRTGPRANHSALTARAQTIMEGALDTPIPVARIARQIGVTPRALQAQFRARFGTTPQAHYLGLRLAEAHRQVTQTTRPLQNIALATGFGSAASFARAFRRSFGQSASLLRAGQ